jgi:hypothetical protein
LFETFSKTQVKSLLDLRWGPLRTISVILIALTLSLYFTSTTAHAWNFNLFDNSKNEAPLWTENRPTPTDGLSNPYSLNKSEFDRQVFQGRIHSLSYPVTTTGVLLPYYPIKTILKSDTNNPIKKILYQFIKGVADVKNFDDMNRWLELNKYPDDIGEGPYFIPRPEFGGT